MLSLQKLTKALKKAGITNMREYREESARRYSLSSVEDWPHDPCAHYGINIMELFAIKKRSTPKFAKALKNFLKLGSSRQVSAAAVGLERKVVSALEKVAPVSSKSPDFLPKYRKVERLLDEIEKIVAPAPQYKEVERLLDEIKKTLKP